MNRENKAATVRNTLFQSEKPKHIEGKAKACIRLGEILITGKAHKIQWRFHRTESLFRFSFLIISYFTLTVFLILLCSQDIYTATHNQMSPQRNLCRWNDCGRQIVIGKNQSKKIHPFFNRVRKKMVYYTPPSASE